MDAGELEGTANFVLHQAGEDGTDVPDRLDGARQVAPGGFGSAQQVTTRRLQVGLPRELATAPPAGLAHFFDARANAFPRANPSQEPAQLATASLPPFDVAPN